MTSVGDDATSGVGPREAGGDGSEAGPGSPGASGVGGGEGRGHREADGRVLVVAGSDPTAGAGLQADLKTVAALGGYALTAVTAITVQDTRGVQGFTPVAPEWVVRQMEVCLADIGADCIKLGMLASPETVAAVCDVLERHPGIPVVADPVLAAGGAGGSLLAAGGLALYRERLLPRVRLLTPNAPEAAALTGLAVRTHAEAREAALRLAELGPAILLTGGHLGGEAITDLLVDGGVESRFRSPRLAGPGFHGTGCALASAAAVGLAQGLALDEAVERALGFVRRATAASLALGGGQRLLGHFPLGLG